MASSSDANADRAAGLSLRVYKTNVTSYPSPNTRPSPPWTMPVAIGPAVTTSKSAGFHHLITNSRPWYKNSRQFPLSDLSKTQSHFSKDRYSPTKSLRRASVWSIHISKVSNSWPTVDWSPHQQLDTTVCLFDYKSLHAPLAVFLIFH